MGRTKIGGGGQGRMGGQGEKGANKEMLLYTNLFFCTHIYINNENLFYMYSFFFNKRSLIIFYVISNWQEHLRLIFRAICLNDIKIKYFST